jgi:F-type H+-transporting ATPase subunit b
MVPLFFAEDATSGSPLAALGVDGKSLIFQLITFILVFLILKKFAFKPITKMLAERRRVIADGILLGEQMEKEKARLEEKSNEVIREARQEADKIISIAHKESRELIHAAEKDAKVKVEAIMRDADQRIGEDAERARRGVEKDIVTLVSEATEAVVHEKVDAKKDTEVIDKVLKDRRK